MSVKLLSREAQRYVEMFGCDTARISQFDDGKMYLILGWNRHTKDDPGQWLKDGEPWDFAYVEEKVVASGYGEAALMESAKRYKALLNKEPETIQRACLAPAPPGQ